MTVETNQPTPSPPSGGRRDGSGQPRWAWWVVGIAIPVAGILATLYGGSSDSADPKGTPETNPSSGASSDAARPTLPKPSSAPAKVMYGPTVIDVTVSSYGTDVDLDTDPPMIEHDLKTADISATSAGDGLVGSTRFFSRNAAHTLAPLPLSTANPTEAECRKAVQRNGTYEVVNLVKGRQFCAVTDEGRTAFVRVMSAPTDGTVVKIALTAWEPAS